jgi:hypothetical protein
MLTRRAALSGLLLAGATRVHAKGDTNIPGTSSLLLSADFCRRVYKSRAGSFSEGMIAITRPAPPDVYTLDRSGTPVGPFGANTLRMSNRGLSAWTNHTQIFRNSDAPATQTRAVEDGASYFITAWNCAVALSGASTGTVSGGRTLAITANGTSLTFTVSDVVAPAFVNCEDGLPEPPIIAGDGTAISGDELNVLDMNNFSWWQGLQRFTVLCAYEPTAAIEQFGAMWELEDGAGINRISTNFIANSQTGTTIADGTDTYGYDPPLPYTIANRLQVYGAAIDLRAKRISVALYDAVQGMSPFVEYPITPSPAGLRYLHFGGQAAGLRVNGYVRGFKMLNAYHASSLATRMQQYYRRFA